MYGVLFQTEAYVCLKNAWLPQPSFWTPTVLA